MLGFPRKNQIVERVVHGAAANLLGKVWITVVQLASIPALSAAWGPEGFGTWLILATIPTYLALSDIGLGTAASTEMTRCMANGDVEGALSVFQSLWVFVTVISAALAVLVAATGLLLSQTWLLPGLTGGEAVIAITALAAYSVLVVQMSALFAAYHATGRYASGTLISELTIPLEGLAVLVVAILGGGIGMAAVALVTVRLPLTLIYFFILRRHEPWVTIGYERASLTSIRRLVPPSLAAFALTAANAMILQGAVVALGATAGAAAAAVFASARTLTRIPVQLASAVSRASMPEMTRAHALSSTVIQQAIHAANLIVAAAVAVPIGIGLALWGPVLLSGLTAERLEASHALFALLAGAAVINALVSALASPLVAANRHDRFAYWYLAAGVLAVGTILGLPSAGSLVAAGAVMMAEAAGAVAVIRATQWQRFGQAEVENEAT